jgi:dTDP-glucose pyrophosphorylase
MKSVKNIKILAGAQIRDALKIIDSGAMQIAVVVDEKDRLLGTITDGDIRRGLLAGLGLDDFIDTVTSKNPTVAELTDTREEILYKALAKRIHQIPIVDSEGVVVGIEQVEDLIKPDSRTNKVVLMVGGLGVRLRPLTNNIPKPMLKVGDRPILETIVRQFAEYGFTDIIMCVNYKSDIIQGYFGDGSNFGVNIEYVIENKRMGTAGALSLLKKLPEEPFFVMNGDLLTKVNFEHLLEFHSASKSVATMCVREYGFQIPYGVVNVDDSKILSIEEKPERKYYVNAGIYMLDPKAVKEIPEGEFYDIPDLFEKLIKNEMTVSSFPIKEYWLDIGQIEEYEKANEEYDDVF